ncbi:MAG: tRNA preQ1(34) S-adenosylmethionine ribosyltransferase-isomerase QueA [Anaerolineaceae bacterium]|nr:tRNA preQ1(34) S-adenosylmethionine ribosyltransferase-isomerase QueA [Anaerolineaceae bacterium]
MMKTEDFNYELPARFIAQQPAEPRDHSKLMLMKRGTTHIAHRYFYELIDCLSPGDLIVVNQTRVIPARFYGSKIPGGGKVEILLLNKKTDETWECLIGGKNQQGTKIQVQEGPLAQVVDVLPGSRRLLRFAEPIECFYRQAGHVPLPPYIHAYQGDPERYQTVYNHVPGSAAAPTAGLHFTEGLMAGLKQKGLNFAEITLHVGLDTFAPVTESDPHTHQIHTEWCELNAQTAALINETKANGKRVIAIGTTTVRTLETAAQASEGNLVQPFAGNTGLFILPGYSFKIVDAMVTNFHLPKSTLLMLVSAFTGKQQILQAYETAKANDYRFFSFGDAMFLY